MISIVGMGPGSAEYLTPQARNIIESAALVYGYPKHLQELQVPEEKARNISGALDSLVSELDALDPSVEAALLVSGDPSVFSLSRRVLGGIDPERIRIIPGLGSYQILCSRLQLQTPLPERVSVHGRDIRNLDPLLLKGRAMMIYTDSRSNPLEVARFLKERGKGEWSFSVGARLGTDEEEIWSGTAAKAAEGLPDSLMDLNLCFAAPPVLSAARSGKAKIYGIGLGPGDPELLTLKALRIIESSDLILCPRARIKSDSLARSILEQAAGCDLPVLEIEYPMAPGKEAHGSRWKEIAVQTAEHLNKKKRVSFVTLGDPGIYSSFSYFLEALLEELPSLEWEIVPGVSSIQLAASRSGIPLVSGRESCVILPAPETAEELDSLLEAHPSLVLMKVYKKIAFLRDYLESRKLLERACFVKRAGLEGESVITDFSMVEPGEEGNLSIVIIKAGTKK